VWGRKKRWQVEGSGGAKFSGEEKIEEQTGATFLLNPRSTSDLGSFWTVDFLPDLPVNPIGFQAFRFLFHPGTTGEEQAPWMALFIGEQQVDLREWIDFSRDEWQTVEIPLVDLKLEKEVERIRFWGWMKGRFHLSEISLIAERSATTAVVQKESGLPQRSALEQNYPNPFNGETTIRFFLAEREEIELAVFDLVGRRVTAVTRGMREAGWHEAMWNGRGMGSGMYLYRLRTENWVEMKKLLLIK